MTVSLLIQEEKGTNLSPRLRRLYRRQLSIRQNKLINLNLHRFRLDRRQSVRLLSLSLLPLALARLRSLVVVV